MLTPLRATLLTWGAIGATARDLEGSGISLFIKLLYIVD